MKIQNSKKITLRTIAMYVRPVHCCIFGLE